MLVAFEGIDGSGKSSVVRGVARVLRREGFRVRVTQEPTSTWLGRAVRKGISSKLDPLALAFLFLSDRAEHAKTFTEGKATIVLTDRYRDSTTAYQAAALDGRLEKPLEFLAALQDRLFPAPDLALLLDVPAEVGIRRIAPRAKKEPFEKVRFLRRVRSNYLRLAGEDRLVVVDATRPLEEVVARCAGLVARRARQG